MAVEYFADAIRATNSDENVIKTTLKDESGTIVTSGNVYFVCDDLSIKVAGTYASDVWSFTIPAKPTITGRYFYHYELEDECITFDAPIYFE